MVYDKSIEKVLKLSIFVFKKLQQSEYKKEITMDTTQVYKIIHIASGIRMSGTIQDLIIKACVVHIQSNPTIQMFKFEN